MTPETEWVMVGRDVNTLTPADAELVPVIFRFLAVAELTEA
jgi:hypothetical protein